MSMKEWAEEECKIACKRENVIVYGQNPEWQKTDVKPAEQADLQNNERQSG